MNHDFLVTITSDGSPTLSRGLHGEKMHSLEGAFSETCHVYLEAVKESLRRGLQPRFLSFGLGLGYVEILTAALVFPKPLKMVSVENEPVLIEAFECWVNGTPPNAAWAWVYDEILKKASAAHKLAPSELKAYLVEGFDSKSLSIVESSKSLAGPFSGICFDPFSRKTNPDLWEVENLSQVLAYLDDKAFFATYASSAALRKILQANGFAVHARPGFGRKRECTLAWRENRITSRTEPIRASLPPDTPSAHKQEQTDSNAPQA